jgi:hypothetical protein
VLQLLLHVLKLRLRIHASRIRTMTHWLLSMNIVERLLCSHERLHPCIGTKVATLVELLSLLRMLLVWRLLLLLLLIQHGRMRRMRRGTWVHWRHILCLNRRMLRMLLLRKRLVLLLRVLELLRMLGVLLRMLTCCTLSARMQLTNARGRTYGSNASRASRMLKSPRRLLRTQMGM